MGQCKRCSNVYGVHEMTNGICKYCLRPEDINNKEESKNTPTEKLIEIYKIAFGLNRLTPISLILGFISLISPPLTSFMMMIILLSIIIGNILSIFILIKFFKKKEYAREFKRLLISLIVLDGLLLLIMWILKGANFHA